MKQGPETVDAAVAPVVTESRGKQFVDFSKKVVHALWLPSVIANLAGVVYLTLAESGKEYAKNNPMLLQVMAAAGVAQLLGGAHALERRRSARKAALVVAAEKKTDDTPAPDLSSDQPEVDPALGAAAAIVAAALETEKNSKEISTEDTDPDKTVSNSEDNSEESDADIVAADPVLNAAPLAREKGSPTGEAAPAEGRVTRRRKPTSTNPS